MWALLNGTNSKKEKKKDGSFFTNGYNGFQTSGDGGVVSKKCILPGFETSMYSL